jgi:hypothetical protein
LLKIAAIALRCLGQETAAVALHHGSRPPAATHAWVNPTAYRIRGIKVPSGLSIRVLTVDSNLTVDDVDDDPGTPSRRHLSVPPESACVPEMPNNVRIIITADSNHVTSAPGHEGGGLG